MRRFDFAENNTILTGVLLGLFTPLVIALLLFALAGFFLAQTDTEQLSPRLIRSLVLLSVCSNIFWIQYYNRALRSQSLRGVIMVTMVMSLVWVFHFYESLNPS